MARNWTTRRMQHVAATAHTDCHRSWRVVCKIVYRARFAPTKNLIIVACSVMLGCGSSELAPVSGVVEVDSHPAGPGIVMFIPQKKAGKKLKAATGRFGKDGRFTLTTFSDGDGAFIGSHGVAVRPLPEDMPEGGPGAEGGVSPRESSIPPQYWNVAQPLLTVNVEPGDNHLTLSVERDGPRSRTSR